MRSVALALFSALISSAISQTADGRDICTFSMSEDENKASYNETHACCSFAMLPNIEYARKFEEEVGSVAGFVSGRNLQNIEREKLNLEADLKFHKQQYKQRTGKVLQIDSTKCAFPLGELTANTAEEIKKEGCKAADAYETYYDILKQEEKIAAAAPGAFSTPLYDAAKGLVVNRRRMNEAKEKYLKLKGQSLDLKRNCPKRK